MAGLGYAQGDRLADQVFRLRSGGLTYIVEEPGPGRAERQALLENLRGGDSLHVTSIDKLGDSLADLQEVLLALHSKDVALMADGDRVRVDVGFLAGIAAAQSCASVWRRARQRSGIDAARQKGVYKGRRSNLSVDLVHGLATMRGMGVTAIARDLKVSRDAVYRVLRRVEAMSERDRNSLDLQAAFHAVSRQATPMRDKAAVITPR